MRCGVVWTGAAVQRHDSGHRGETQRGVADHQLQAAGAHLTLLCVGEGDERSPRVSKWMSN
jgi:hypothetical protein